MKITIAAAAAGVLLGLCGCSISHADPADHSDAVLTPVVALSYDDYRAQLRSSCWGAEVDRHRPRGAVTRVCD